MIEETKMGEITDTLAQLMRPLPSDVQPAPPACITTRELRLEECLRKALGIIQFSLANLDGNTKGWPEADIRMLGQLVAADELLTPVEREVGSALQIWAAPVLHGPTVQTSPTKRSRPKRKLRVITRNNGRNKTKAKRKRA